MVCGNRVYRSDIGAIAGMLGAALYGAEAIPERWLEKLELHVLSEIEQQVGELLRLAGAGASASALSD